MFIIQILFLFFLFFHWSTAVALCREDVLGSTPTIDFTLNSDGTTIHHKTGLMWSRCSFGQTWDKKTGVCSGAVERHSFQKALQIAETSKFAGYNDWRIPNIKELVSIIETSCSDPAINGEVFPNMPTEFTELGYWSSTSRIDTNDIRVWGVHFKRGENSGGDITQSTHSIRLVRAGSRYDPFDLQEEIDKHADFLNISTRGYVGANELNMHAGIVVIGPETVQVLVKALGPSLSPELDGLQDPFLRWFDADTGELLHQNDDWQDDPSSEQIKTLGLAPTDPNEPAFLLDVPAGSYTAVVSGMERSAGIAIPSATRIGGSTDSKKDGTHQTQFLNISTRGFVGPGAFNMHAGIVVTGPGIVPVLVKAAGPSLLPTLNGLQDPSLRLFDVSNGKLLHENDNWQDDPSASLVSATGMAPSDPREPGFIVYLPKGSYTAVVSGMNGATGIAIPSATKMIVGDLQTLP